MTLQAAIFGFGSFFKGREQFRDVDLLVVHDDGTVPSCNLAVRCKKRLLEEIKGAQVTMLSRSEEHQLDFVREAAAIVIDVVNDSTAESDLDRVVGILCANVALRNANFPQRSSVVPGFASILANKRRSS